MVDIAPMPAAISEAVFETLGICATGVGGEEEAADGDGDGDGDGGGAVVGTLTLLMPILLGSPSSRACKPISLAAASPSAKNPNIALLAIMLVALTVMCTSGRALKSILSME
jgi:hypothetical protein